MCAYSQGIKERLVKELTNFYMFRDIILPGYDTAVPEDQESILDGFYKIHKRATKVRPKDEHEAKKALSGYFAGMTERGLWGIKSRVLMPKSKKQRLKEETRKASGKRPEPYCKAEMEQLSLF